MNLFHLNAGPAPSLHQAPRPSDVEILKTWLIVANSVAEAIALVPDGQAVVSVEIHSPCKPGPARVVGWMGPPPSLPPAVAR